MLIISSAIGWAATFFAILKYQVKSLRSMIFINGTAALLIAIHLTIEQHLAGAAISYTVAAVSFTQALIGYKLSTPLKFAIATPAIILCIWLTNTQTWVSLLPVLSFTIGRYSETLTNDKAYRHVSFSSSGIWMVYYSITGSLPGFIFELTGVLSNAYGLRRYHKKQP